LRGQDL